MRNPIPLRAGLMLAAMILWVLVLAVLNPTRLQQQGHLREAFLACSLVLILPIHLLSRCCICLLRRLRIGFPRWALIATDVSAIFWLILTGALLLTNRIQWMDQLGCAAMLGVLIILFGGMFAQAVGQRVEPEAG